MSVTIRLPWISAKLNAHNKGHWRSKLAPTKKLRQIAALEASKHTGVSFTSARVVYTFYVPDNLRRDTANMIQSLKPAIDGIVDSGLLSGDHWQVLDIAGINVEIDRLDPRVELTFVETRRVVVDGFRQPPTPSPTK